MIEKQLDSFPLEINIYFLEMTQRFRTESLIGHVYRNVQSKMLADTEIFEAFNLCPRREPLLSHSRPTTPSFLHCQNANLRFSLFISLDYRNIEKPTRIHKQDFTTAHKY